MADDLERHVASFLTWHDLRAVRQTCRRPGMPRPAPVAWARLRCRAAWQQWLRAPRRRRARRLLLGPVGRSARRHPNDPVMLF